MQLCDKNSEKTNSVIEKVFKPPNTKKTLIKEHILKLVRYNISMIEILKSMSFWNKFGY